MKTCPKAKLQVIKIQKSDFVIFVVWNTCICFWRA